MRSVRKRIPLTQRVPMGSRIEQQSTNSTVDRRRRKAQNYIIEHTNNGAAE